MTEFQRAELRKLIEPLCETIAASYLEAMILRCDVCHTVAVYNGAESEDAGEIVAKAIASGREITARYLDELGMVERAKLIAKGELE